ncbi:MAG TPA: M28 family metallopeptidase [Solirubrobacterales bacterium]|nr:M28 family metallopeptidase [Solirubrobacterales bacterium]
MTTLRVLVLAVAVSSLAAACGGEGERVDPGGAAARFDAERSFADLRDQVALGPRSSGSPGSRREIALIASRLRAAGVRSVVVQRPLPNVVATIPGRSPGTVVIGAHHDTKAGIPGFAGANDGASGVAVLLELARVLPQPYPGPSVTLAFFDGEEARGDRRFESDGMRGSRQFVRLARKGGRRGTPALRSIRALYLLDMVGDCDLALPREANSEGDLYSRLEGEPFGGEAAPVLDDHVPFLEAGVPAVAVIDFAYGPGPPPGAWWHTPADSLDKVCPASLGLVGRAVVGALGTL